MSVLSFRVVSMSSAKHKTRRIYERVRCFRRRRKCSRVSPCLTHGASAFVADIEYFSQLNHKFQGRAQLLSCFQM